jgi:hypothetical protein
MSARIDEIDPLLLAEAPIWRYFEGGSPTETLAEPTGEKATDQLVFKFIGLRVRLANGDQRWALLFNLSPHDAVNNEHFLTLSIENRGRWFPLARYHDADWERMGPPALADFLSLPIEQVFPLEFDASAFVKNATVPLSGRIEAEPRSRLSSRELIDLAIASS